MGIKKTFQKLHASANPKAAEKLAREEGKSDAEVEEAVKKAKKGEETVIISAGATTGAVGGMGG